MFDFICEASEQITCGLSLQTFSSAIHYFPRLMKLGAALRSLQFYYVIPYISMNTI